MPDVYANLVSDKVFRDAVNQVSSRVIAEILHARTGTLRLPAGVTLHDYTEQLVRICVGLTIKELLDSESGGKIISRAVAVPLAAAPAPDALPQNLFPELEQRLFPVSAGVVGIPPDWKPS